MKMKKMRTLDIRSIITFSTRIKMLRGAKASFLSLLLKTYFGDLNLLNNFFYLIFTIETVIVMKENNIETVLRVTSSFMSMSLESKT